MIAPVPQAPPSTYLKPTDVHVAQLEKQSIDRQRREFERVKAELQAAHTKRVSAKTRVELRVPQEAISPLRDLGSAALRPGIPTVTPTRPGGSMPVFKGVLKELKAIRKEDARKAIKGLSGLVWDLQR